MKYLVTGAGGFIGSSLSEQLLRQGHEVVGVDNFLPNLYASVIKENRIHDLRKYPNFDFKFLDLRVEIDPKLFAQVDRVFHLAAMAGLSKSWSEFEIYQDCNLLATFNILEAIKLSDCQGLIYASTSSVYGTRAMGNEESELKPSSPYGVTKLAAENLIKSYKEVFGINFTILRYFSVFGPNQRPDMAYSKIIKAIFLGEEFQVFGDGLQSRTNTFISDIVSATILSSQNKLGGEIYNVCGSEEVSLNVFIEMAAQYLEKRPKLKFGAPIPGDQKVTSGDASKIKNHFGWSAEMPFEEGVKQQVQTFLELDSITKL